MQSPGTKRSKILIVTHSPVLPTGTAETMRSIFNTLLKLHPDDYELHQLGLGHVGGAGKTTWPIYLTRVEVHPGKGWTMAKSDLDGRETFPIVLANLQPDIVFAFNDPQNLQHLCVERSKRQHRLVLYVHVDGFPAPPDYACLFASDKILTMSDFSRNALLAGHPGADSSNVDFLYAPADTRRFHPVCESERTTLRREWLPAWMPANAFILGWVGMNQWRKQPWVLYQVIHLLRTGHYLVCPDCQRVQLRSGDGPECEVDGGPEEAEAAPETGRVCAQCGSHQVDLAEPLTDIFLWLHMPRIQARDCWPTNVMHETYDVFPGRDIHYTEGLELLPNLSAEKMAALYQVWDALLYLSGGEGFGVPALEAMASELPVVYTDYSSHAEFLGKANAGLPVGGTLQPEPSTCTLRILADVGQALEAVRRLYFDPELRRGLGRSGRAFAEQISCKNQAERWHHIFQGANQ
jgi:glycosyltransferase involved in cell wall biosynthesis